MAKNLAFTGLALGLGLYALPLQSAANIRELALWGGIHSTVCLAAGYVFMVKRKEKEHILTFVRKRMSAAAAEP